MADVNNTRPGIGDTCYNQHGQQAEVLAYSAGAFIVRPVYEDDDGEHLGEVETWSAVFRTPPAPKMDAATKAAEERLQSLRAQVAELERKQYEFTRDEKARMDRIKQHEGLEMLDRYLAGEITHYVTKHSYYPTVAILPLGETLDEHRSSNGFGLLSIMPTVQWDKRVTFSVCYHPKNSRYSSDSRSETVIPCCGLEQAQKVVAETLANFCAEQLDKPVEKRSYTAELIACCQAHKVPVPQALVDGMNEQNRKALEAQRDKAAKELAEITAKLEAQEVA